MPRFRDFPWWPTEWVDEKGRSVSPAPTDGILKNVRRVDNDLVMIVEHDRVVGTAIIRSQLSDDFLILLRHILLQHLGEPLSAVESVEVDLGALK